MTRYQEIAVSRLRVQSERLLSRLNEADSRNRRVTIEPRVIQLENEGLVLNRDEEVDRLSRMSDSDVERAIESMRRNYRRRGLQRDTREEDTVQPGITPIFGHAIARFAMEEEEEGRPIVPYRKTDNGLPPHLARRQNALKRAKLGVRRFQQARSDITRV